MFEFQILFHEVGYGLDDILERVQQLLIEGKKMP